MCRVCRVCARPLHTCDPLRIRRVQGVQGVQGGIRVRGRVLLYRYIDAVCSHVRARISPAHPAHPNKHGAFALHRPLHTTLHTLHKITHFYPQPAL